MSETTIITKDTGKMTEDRNENIFSIMQAMALVDKRTLARLHEMFAQTEQRLKGNQ
jgi:hypothetical protein